jgi:polyphosphate kinase
MERAQSGRPARIFAKLNALVDYRVIETLYRASQAGVPVELLVRGVCCLRPGIPGVSDNIRVTSIVDRFLEHSRIYVFGPDDEAKVYLSSADWMPRNFHRRVEVMFPVEAVDLRDRVLHEIIGSYRRDNVRTRVLRSDGTYYRVKPAPGETPFRVQEELLAIRPGIKAAGMAMGDVAEIAEPAENGHATPTATPLSGLPSA